MGCVLFELIQLKLAFPSGPQIGSIPDLSGLDSRFVPILNK